MITRLNEGTRRSRTPHPCFHCHKLIPSGTQLCFAVHVDSGTVHTTYSHAECEAVFRRLIMLDYIDDREEIMEDTMAITWEDNREEIKLARPGLASRLEAIFK